jgi:large subunit ribosomal protein L18
MANTAETKRIYRHRRIRKTMSGTAARPRLCVHRSLKNMSVSLIDDSTAKVITGLSTLAKEVKSKVKSGGNVKGAEALGEVFATMLLAKGIKAVCFDRGGYIYHGRVKAFADAARKAGLEF